jgi:diguanylate cyclase (GGDEF)-like protein
MVYFEIFIHTIVATLLLGWELGFPFYNLALIPVSYYVAYTTPTFKRKLFSPTLLMGINMTLTIAACIINTAQGNMYNVNSSHFIVEVHIFNILIAFVFLLLFSLFFVIEISRTQAILVTKNRQLASLANFDPLTKLLNRRSIQPFFSNVLQSKEQFCIVISDIDDFKKVNDTYGHRCGDQVLMHVANLCRESLGTEDVLCRWGGEEFLFILGGDEERCVMLTEKLRAAIAYTQFSFEKTTIRITMTFGIQQHVENQPIDDTIKLADDKLYEGKGKGKNKVVW